MVQRSVTLTDVSRRANVSAMTVSRVLNHAVSRGGESAASISISDATRRRVLRAAQALGYRPNAAARTMATGRFFSVGLVLSSNAGASHLPSVLLDAIHDELARRGLHLTVAKL